MADLLLPTRIGGQGALISSNEKSISGQGNTRDTFEILQFGIDFNSWVEKDLKHSQMLTS
jgi:hypothetical protein